MTIEEEWKVIDNFPDYKISNLGRVYNIYRDRVMRTSFDRFGHMKITLRSGEDGERYTRSVAKLVGEAFVDAVDFRCDHIMVLDGDYTNVVAHNLMWRPRWFVWKYSHQLKTVPPLHYINVSVVNVVSGKHYGSIVEAGIREGLLFDDIWKSTYTGFAFYPNRAVFEIEKGYNVGNNTSIMMDRM